MALAEGRERAGALKAVEQEIEQQVEAVIDAHPEHSIAAAEGASEAAAEAIATAKAGAQAAAIAWREAAGAWSTVRLSRGRRRLDTPPNVPISDFGNAVGELEKSQSRPVPWRQSRGVGALPRPRVQPSGDSHRQRSTP